MCPKPTEDEVVGDVDGKEDELDQNVTLAAIGFCGVVTVTSLIAAIILGNKAADSGAAAIAAIEPTNVVVNPEVSVEFPISGPPKGENPCEGKKKEFDFPNVECYIEAMTNVGPQAGGNVTKGYNGQMEVDYVPIKDAYYKHGLCPVNVHWHLGTEHNSAGQFDAEGTGPHTGDEYRRKLAAGEKVRGGFRCHHYDENDMKFTKPYDWKHCVGMEVGETYEVHWPHSAVGACGTPNQYQTPFYDGVFCHLDALPSTPQDIANAVGVQGQVFTIVNDEDYYWPDLMHGMIVDGDFGTDLAIYTGSTTGTSRDNEMCSQYTPITWQVDRKCHMVSASTFDKMCADMLAQRDDMSDDLYAHGSRELVDEALTANNHANRFLRN